MVSLVRTPSCVNRATATAVQAAPEPQQAQAPALAAVSQAKALLPYNYDHPSKIGLKKITATYTIFVSNHPRDSNPTQEMKVSHEVKSMLQDKFRRLSTEGELENAIAPYNPNKPNGGDSLL